MVSKFKHLKFNFNRNSYLNKFGKLKNGIKNQNTGRVFLIGSKIFLLKGPLPMYFLTSIVPFPRFLI